MGFEVRFGTRRSAAGEPVPQVRVRDQRTGKELTFPGHDRTGWADWIVEQFAPPDRRGVGMIGDRRMIDRVVGEQVIEQSPRQEKLTDLYRQDMAAKRAGDTRSERVASTTATELQGSANANAHAPVSNETAPGGFRQISESSYGTLGPPEHGNDLEVETAAGAGRVVTEALSEGMLELEFDDEYALDAWYAEFGTPGMTTLLRNPSVNSAMTEAQELIWGDDDRLPITNGLNEEYPWRCICSLRMVAADGSPWIGTGWLVGPRTVVTAGHCVYMHDRGGWVTAVEVIPGRDVNQRPFGSCIARDFRSVVGWTQSHLRSHDYGAIILPPGCAFGETVGWFNHGHYEDGMLANSVVNVSGYPGDLRPVGGQWFHSRSVERLTPTTIEYLIDTFKGQSGGPVWWLMPDGERIAVGIHTNGDHTANSATRITEEVYNNIVAWKDLDA